MKYESGAACKCLFAMLEGGAGPLMAKVSGSSRMSGDSVALTLTSVTAASHSNTGTSTPVPVVIIRERGEGRSGAGKEKEKGKAPKPDPALAALSVLNGVYFEKLGIAGWAVKLGNNDALSQLLAKGVSASVPVDENGNTCLHLAAYFGNVGAVKIVIESDYPVKFEYLNRSRRTPVMVGAVAGHVETVIELCRLGCDPRRGLDGKYWGWLLAIARRKEMREQNLQTGIFGEDDVRYFPTAPDPAYLVWYNAVPLKP